jgi:hypothetical protein
MSTRLKMIAATLATVIRPLEVFTLDGASLSYLVLEPVSKPSRA